MHFFDVRFTTKQLVEVGETAVDGFGLALGFGPQLFEQLPQLLLGLGGRNLVPLLYIDHEVEEVSTFDVLHQKSGVFFSSIIPQ